MRSDICEFVSKTKRKVVTGKYKVSLGHDCKGKILVAIELWGVKTLVSILRSENIEL